MDYFLRGLSPPPIVNVDAWSDKYRQLPGIASDESGQWHTSRTPYLKEIMQELSPSSPTEDIVFMKGSQVGATECGINWALYNIDGDPGPMLAVQPSIDMAKLWSVQRLTPSINECERVSALVSENKSRGSGNVMLKKLFPGGIMILGGANSAASLRSMPIEKLFCDEIDGYPDDVDGEGDPVDLAVRRTTNFARRKRYYVSTPTVKGASRIESLFEESDQRFYNVPCPECNELQVITWDNIKFKDRDPDSVYLQCFKCKFRIDEYRKTWMLERGVWVKKNPGAKKAGFHLSALYSPLGWYSWAEAVDEHIKALSNPLKRKVWTNTVLGETFDPSLEAISTGWLMKRREKYDAEIPNGPVVLTAGVDTQDNRLEVTVDGWGAEWENWTIAHEVFWGDTSQNDVWRLLDDYLLKIFKTKNGDQLNIAATCVDSGGHRTDEVYKFCKARSHRRVFAIKGMHGAGRPIIGAGSKTKRIQNYLFIVGVDQAKATIYSRLKIPKPGPGYVHFPEKLEKEYFNQLTSEHRVKKMASGLPKFVWTLAPGRRNEALDCKVYSLAALTILNPNIDLLVKENVLLKVSHVRRQRKRGVRSPGL